MKLKNFFATFLLCLKINIIMAQTKPNIIVVMVDDQGYGDMSCHGNPVVNTPNIDILYKNSIRFIDYHAAPMCTPTRGQLMTGMHCLQNKAMNVSSGRALLSTKYKTLPQILKQNGYKTGLFGKWHLGDNYPFRPQDRGFDECVWFPSSHIGSVPDTWLNDYFDDTYLHKDKKQIYKGYTTDVFFKESIDWMQQQAQNKKSFFTYIATASPHSPLYCPKENFNKAWSRVKAQNYTHLTENEQFNLAKFLGMIENVDENIQRLNVFLEESGLAQNTIIIYTTDNGSTMGHKYYNAGMKGSKVTLWEGGHRVPLFIKFPNKYGIKAREINTLSYVQDLFPSILEMCSIKNYPKNQGQNLLPLITKNTPFPDRKLIINYSRMPYGERTSTNPIKEESVVMWQKWRLIEEKELYNLENDPFQEHNVAANNPTILASMIKANTDFWENIHNNVNEPERIIIGHPNEPNTLISSCEWWNVFMDQQSQIRQGNLKNSEVNLTIFGSGLYKFTISRWPLESNLQIIAAAPAESLTDGFLGKGLALPIKFCNLKVGAVINQTTVSGTDKFIEFTLNLTKGNNTLKCDFLDENKNLLVGAYYVYIKKIM